VGKHGLKSVIHEPIEEDLYMSLTYQLAFLGTKDHFSPRGDEKSANIAEGLAILCQFSYRC
jgi:hypothetical protein